MPTRSTKERQGRRVIKLLAQITKEILAQIKERWRLMMTQSHLNQVLGLKLMPAWPLSHPISQLGQRTSQLTCHGKPNLTRRETTLRATGSQMICPSMGSV